MSEGGEAARPARRVRYLHHTRDGDGDVVMFFREVAGGEVMRSSPVTGLRREARAVLDRHGSGDLCAYRVCTENTDYLVEMPKGAARHLALEVGGPGWEVT